MLKPNTSPQIPRIELSNDTFAERKYCQFSAYESETFHRQRSYGISHCENGEQKPPKRPLPVGLRWPPCNTAVPRPTASTTRNRSSDGWGTVSHVRRQVPIGYNGAVQIRPQKYPFRWTDCQTPIPASSADPSDVWCRTAAGCDLPFFHNALDRQTDRPTDRTRESLMTIGRCAPRATRPNNAYVTIVCYFVLTNTVYWVLSVVCMQCVFLLLICSSLSLSIVYCVCIVILCLLCCIFMRNRLNYILANFCVTLINNIGLTAPDYRLCGVSLTMFRNCAIRGSLH